MQGRRIDEVKGINNHDFIKLANTTGTFRERRRFLAFAHIQRGERLSSIAKMLMVHPRTLSAWIMKFRKQGIDGLKEKSGRGRKSVIPPEEYTAFQSAVEELQKNRNGGRVRRQDIQKMIETRYNVHVPNSTVYAILKRSGLVWITGRSRHPKANCQLQEDFKKNLKPL